MEPQSTTSTTIYTFDYSDLGKIELGWGISPTEALEHQGGSFQVRFIPGLPSSEKGARVNDNFLTNAAGKIFQKAGDVADRLVRILRQEYCFQARR